MYISLASGFTKCNGRTSAKAGTSHSPYGYEGRGYLSCLPNFDVVERDICHCAGVGLAGHHANLTMCVGGIGYGVDDWPNNQLIIDIEIEAITICKKCNGVGLVWVSMKCCDWFSLLRLRAEDTLLH